MKYVIGFIVLVLLVDLIRWIYSKSESYTPTYDYTDDIDDTTTDYYDDYDEEVAIEDEEITATREHYLNSDITKQVFEFLGPETPCKIVIDYENVYATYADGTSRNFSFLANKIKPFDKVFYIIATGNTYGDKINRPLRFAEALNFLFGGIYEIKPENNAQVEKKSETREDIHCTLIRIELIPNDLRDF